MNSDFLILNSTYHRKEKQLDFKVKLPSEDTSLILKTLSSLGNIRQFNETIPSTNDIFIETVKSKMA